MSPDGFHIDYPLLQTGYIARCWLLMKNESVFVPILFSFIYTFGTIGLLSSSISDFKNKTEGLIAGLILLCTPFYMTMGDSQYADNTIGFFFLATFVLLTFAYKSSTNKNKLLQASGFMAGLAAWTKNEGLLFILSLILSLGIVSIINKRKGFLADAKYLLMGIAPILIILMYYKISIAPANDLLLAQGSTSINKLLDGERYKTVLTWYLEQFTTFGKWIINPWWLFLIGILIKGVNFKTHYPVITISFITILLMFFGYFFIYITSYIDLVFHLSTSLHRLFFQLFPSFIFLYFILIKDSAQSEGALNVTV